MGVSRENIENRQMERRLGYTGRIEKVDYIRTRPGYGCSFCKSSDGMIGWHRWNVGTTPPLPQEEWYMHPDDSVRVYSPCPYCSTSEYSNVDISDYEKVSEADVIEWLKEWPGYREHWHGHA